MGGGGAVGGATVVVGMVEVQLVLSRMILWGGMISTRLKIGSVIKACLCAYVVTRVYILSE